jgi:hypothetical protein
MAVLPNPDMRAGLHEIGKQFIYSIGNAIRSQYATLNVGLSSGPLWRRS